jgi:hypothetical protein
LSSGFFCKYPVATITIAYNKGKPEKNAIISSCCRYLKKSVFISADAPGSGKGALKNQDFFSY